ncbi:hypothetical protein [Methylomonas sp. DH-1]|uniref:hypothetical protein n=1 Tax=Methylomonas sp. (strain DH-1) TaxID=1727196 RepID=UPI0007C8C3B3|nr:hypothetical protein [Methylomonas sp. DH-1]ANE54730.1 hypothetical protein AYM39_05725 [Methylomonas sp. DH-1]
MSYFLWVEDFASVDNSRNIKGTADKLFGGIYPPDTFFDEERVLKDSLKKHNTFLELTFQDALNFINTRLNDVDYIILDIDLPAYGDDEIDESVLGVLKEFEGYTPSNDPDDERNQVAACDRLKKNAGFYLYAKLVFELGFPKQHIQFFSNHGNEAKTIEASFRAAKITPPEIYLKSDDSIRQWVGDCFNSPYSRLRRGIIEGCKQLKKLKNNLRFSSFSVEGKSAFLDADDYIDILENFLPLREPENKTALYKLFIRTLAHEWEESVEPKRLDEDQVTFAFSWIMKMTRNWIAHNSTSIFTNLIEKDVAYLFICNMRAIFDLGSNAERYEEYLLELFVKETETGNIEDSKRKIMEKNIPLVKHYVSYFNEKTKRTKVHNILHDLQNNKERLKTKGDDFFITGLYHCFWYLTSEHDDKKDKAAENRNDPNQVYISRFYTFKCFDYSQSDFLLKFSSHIYRRSFLRPNQ